MAKSLDCCRFLFPVLLLFLQLLPSVLQITPSSGSEVTSDQISARWLFSCCFHPFLFLLQFSLRRPTLRPRCPVTFCRFFLSADDRRRLIAPFDDDSISLFEMAQQLWATKMKSMESLHSLKKTCHSLTTQRSKVYGDSRTVQVRSRYTTFLER